MNVISIAGRVDEDDRVLSNEAAECLRKWLEMAERGEIVSVALVGELKRPGTVATGHSHAATQYCVIGGLAALQAHLIALTDGDAE